MKKIIPFLFIFNFISFGQSESLTFKTHLDYTLSNMMTFGSHPDFRSTFNTGFEFRKRLGESAFHLQSGLRWNEFGFGTLISKYIWNGVAYVGHVYYYKSTRYILSVPLIATWKSQKKIPGLTISAGTQVGVLLFKKFKRDDDVNFYTENQSIQFIGHVSVGYERTINEKWILGAQLCHNSIIPEGFYNVGLGVSANYILK